MLHRLFFEQYSHEPNIATARFWLHHLERTPEREAALVRKHTAGHEALRVMEQHLREQPFFVGGRYSIADICLYAYTHVAHQGGFELAPFPKVRNWLTRVREQPRHVPMPAK